MLTRWGNRVGIPVPITVGVAALLVLAYPASKLADAIITEDVTGYRLLTLCGLAAAAALAVGWWREGGRIAALAAAAPFEFAAYASGSHWYEIASGAYGRRLTQPSPLLPFFVAVAALGVACCLVLAVAWWRRRDRATA